MNAQEDHAKSVFLSALEREPQQWAAYLDEVCAGDAALRERVEELLRAHREMGSIADGGGDNGAAAVATLDEPMRECVGMEIGPYKLLQQLGEGGMGTVFLAQQSRPVERMVALKLIKPGMDSRQVIARFEAERQALALMDHPNIARVLDAGTTDSGRPYFVMELVKGMPITKYCDQHRLSPRQRLELFLPVCHAVQHAHQKGIIHRDVKPSNVMVSLYDGKPVPKVIDFGVAKATGSRLTDRTLFTAIGSVVGTFEYMSPEQAELNQLDVDTRTDIYSLGVLLYELLTGTTPLDRRRLGEFALLELLRAIREDEPPRPSTRISTSEGAAGIAANRSMEPGKLSGMMRGELDWIVMRALEKDRTRRYETANGFAMDVQRYLADEQVLACPPSLGYRMRKFTRRNRVAIITATLVAAALVLGTVMSTWQAIRAETARKAEKQQRLDADAARQAEAEQRKAADEARDAAEKQRELAEANFQKARKAVDEYFTIVSESTLFDVPGLQPLRKELLDAALRFYQTTAIERTDDPDVLADLVVTYFRVAQVNHTIDRNDDAMVANNKALDVVERLLREFPEHRQSHKRLAGFWRGYRPTQMRTQMPQDYQATLQTLERIIATWQQLADENPDVPEFQSDLAAMCYLTGLLQGGVEDGESLRYYERAQKILEKLVLVQPEVPEHRADLARVEQVMAETLARAGRRAEADVAQRRSLSLREKLVEEHPNLPQYRTELSVILYERARAIARQQPAEAGEMFERSARLSFSLVREFPQATIYWGLLSTSLNGWGNHVFTAGNSEQLDRFQKCVEEIKTYAADSPNRLSATPVLVAAYRGIAQMQTGPERLQTIKKAIAECRRAVDDSDSQRGSPESSPDSQVMLATLAGLISGSPGLASLVSGSGQSAEAVETAEQLVEVAEQLAQANQVGFARLGHTCRWLRGMPGHEEDYSRKAIAAFERCIAQEPHSPADRRFLAVTYVEFGQYLLNHNELAEAASCFQKATAIYEALIAEFPADPQYPTLLAQSYVGSIQILLAGGDPAKADEAIQETVEKLEKLAADAPNKPDIELALANFHNEVATALWGAGRIKEAEQRYRQAATLKEELVAEFPANPDYRFHLAHSHLGLAYLTSATNRPEDAAEFYEQALAIFEKLADEVSSQPNHRVEAGHILWQLGSLASAAGKHDKAEEYHRRALAAFEKLAVDFPGNAFYRQEQGFSNWYLGDLLKATGRLPEAESQYRDSAKVYGGLVADDPENAEYRSRLARSYAYWIDVQALQGKTADVLASMRTAIEQYPTGWQQLAGFLRELEREEERKQFVQMLVDTLPESADDLPAHMERGNLYRELGDLDKAIDQYSWVIEREPKRAEAWDSRGNCYVHSGQFAKAIEDYSRAIELDPRNGWYWHERAYSHLMLGQHDEAIADHTTSIEISDQDAGQRFRRGLSYASLGRWQMALDDYTRAIEFNGNDWNIWHHRAFVYLRLKEIDSAYRDFIRAADLQPNPALYLNNMAWGFATAVNEGARNTEMAVKLAKRGIELDPQLPVLPNTLGVAHYRAGNWQQAIEWLERSTQVRNGGDSFDWFFLAMAHWQLGNKEKARELYDQAAEWMDINAADNDELQRFRAEAEKLLGMEEKEPAVSEQR